MCDFHEPYFGASYPDACCIDGFLWDLDSCEEPGGALSSGGDVPCPQCAHADWLESFKDEVEMEGWEAFERGDPRNPVLQKVRWQQPEDHPKMAIWWVEGWDAAQLAAARQPLAHDAARKEQP